MARATLRAKATLDSREFNTKLAKMGQNVDAFSTGTLAKVGSAIGGAFAVGAITRFARSQMEAADRTADLVANLGIGAEALQALEVSALKSGGSLAQVEKAMVALRRRQGEAIRTNTEFRKGFAELGVTVEELREMSLEQLLQAVANGAQAMRDAGREAEALNAVDKVLSETGRELFGVLQDVAHTGLGDLISQGKAAGTVMEERIVKTLADANNELEQFGKKSGNIITIFLANVVKGYGTIPERVMEMLAPESLARGRARQEARRRAQTIDPGMPGGVDLRGANLVDQATKDARDYEIKQEREHQRKKRAEENKTRRDEWLARQERISEVELETQTRIEGIEDMFAERLASISFGDISPASSLAAVGGFLGGQSADNRFRREQAVQELQAERLQDINDTLKDQDAKLAEIQASVED